MNKALLKVFRLGVFHQVPEVDLEDLEWERSFVCGRSVHFLKENSLSTPSLNANEGQKIDRVVVSVLQQRFMVLLIC
jgi:hypothetical protein